jgi:chromosome segregation ATPase
MVSLIEELEARETAARVRVEELEAEIAELTARLVGEREVWSRLRVTRETVAQVLAELSGRDVAETAPLQEPVAPRRRSPKRGWWGRSWCRTGGKVSRRTSYRMCTATSWR